MCSPPVPARCRPAESNCIAFAACPGASTLLADARLGKLDRHPQLEQFQIACLDDDLPADLALLRRKLRGEAVTAGIDGVVQCDGDDPLPLAPFARLHCPASRARPAAWEDGGNGSNGRQGRLAPPLARRNRQLPNATAAADSPPPP